MTASTNNIITPALTAGDDRTLEILFTIDGSPEDITGDQITVRFWDDNISITKTVGAGITIPPQILDVLGSAFLELSQLDTDGILEATILNYEVEKINTSGKKNTTDRGIWNILKNNIP